MLTTLNTLLPVFLRKSSLLALTIHTKDLVKTYGNRTVVNHVSINVKQGEIVGLLGPNGAGKTTTFYMVVGLIKPDKGEVFLDTREITKLPMYKRAQMGIGYLPQEASVFRKLSVEDNVMAVLEMTKLPKKEQKEKLEALLDEFRLHHVRKNNGDSLSGGERRRTEIARALAVDPKFMLLDEPFAGVDPIAVEDIQAVVARLKHKNIGILITDHNVNETLSICDRAYLLIEGKIFKHGTADELAADEQVRKLYLGRNFELKRKDYLHDEARQQLDNVDQRTFNYINDFIYQVDLLRNLSGSELRQKVDEISFFDYLKSFLRITGEYAEKVGQEKITTYISQIKEIDIKEKWDRVYRPGSTDSSDEHYTEHTREKAFKEALSDARPILENISLIVTNPEFSKVLSS